MKDDRKRITEKLVASLTAHPDKAAKGNDTFFWDDGLSGFGVKVTPAGAKSYVFQYRRPNGDTKRMTLGRAGSTATAAARDAAEDAFAALRRGDDPQGAKMDARNAQSISDHANSWLTSLRAKVARKALSQRTYDDYASKLKLHLLPAFGRLKPVDLTPRVIIRWQERMLATPTEMAKGRPLGEEGIKGCLRVLSALCGYLVASEAVTSNPASGLGQFTTARRERFLTGGETQSLGDVLDRWRERAPHWIAAIELALVSGMRKGEILGLRWDAIMEDEGFLHLREHKTARKTGAKRIPITAPMLEVLQAAKAWRIAGNPYVFPSVASRAVHQRKDVAKLDNRRGHMSAGGLKRAWLQIRKEAGLGDDAAVRIHDLRHNWASVAITNGVPLSVIGKNLGHTNSATTTRYAHIEADAASAGANTVADAVKLRMAKRPAGDKVVKLTSA